MSTSETRKQPRSGSGPTARGVARPWQGGIRLTLVAVLVGLLTGAITEALVLRVPTALLPLSNSAAPWIAVAFIVALGARSLSRSLLIAVAVLLSAVVGFYVAQATRGWPLSAHQLVFWVIVALVAGPAVGLAAGCIRHRDRPISRAAGSGTVGGVLVGEAIHGLRQPAFLSPHPYWMVQLAVGILIAVTFAARWSQVDRSQLILRLSVALAACAAAALTTAVFYQIA